MLEKFAVSRDDSIYHAWPDIILTEAGELLCTFTQCVSHGDRSRSRVMLTRSADRGRTWSDKEPFSEETPREFCFNNARITKLRDGSLIVVCDRVDRADNNREDGPGTVIYLWRGDADGRRWDEPVILPFCGIVPDKLLELRSGRWLIAAHNRNPESDRLEQYLWYSDDKGATWSQRVTVAADPRYNLCEASVLELSDGALVAFMRENSGIGIDCQKAISHDGGASWQGVYPAPIPACHRPVSGHMLDGRIMITHRYMHGGRCWTNLALAAFTDEESARQTERNAQRVRMFPLDCDRNAAPDQGYTGWVQFADGEIYVVNYIKDDAPKGQIRGYVFYPDDALL